MPGQTIGILGGGQLGRMLCADARRMGYRTIVLDPSADCPASQTAGRHIQAELDDVKAALALAQEAAVVTVEWELIPAEILRTLENEKPVFPSSKELAIIQDRLSQKKFLKENGFPQTDFLPIEGRESLEAAVRRIGFPCRVKRRRSGYDGKGQLRLNRVEDLNSAAEILQAPCILEAHVAFQKEISVILALNSSGQTAVFPVAENVHRNGILHSTRVPARVSSATEKEARRLALAAARALGHIGVLAVEMFVLENGRLLVNEIAPRVHNSGHYTLGACATSQFEQHLRAICGLPLGDTALLSHAAMVNLLGDLWRAGEPNWDTLLRHPNLKLHLYGKSRPAPGRKMGHILFLGSELDSYLEFADLWLRQTATSSSPAN